MLSKLKLVNFQWELLTGLYMLEPWEKLLFNSIFVIIVAAVVFASNEVAQNVGQLLFFQGGAPQQLAPSAAGGRVGGAATGGNAPL